MTTLAQWVEEVRAHVDADRTEDANQLDVDYTAGSGTVTLRYDLGVVGVNTILSVGTNTLRVMSTNPVAKQATVIAGWNGSTDANATAGTLVRVNPRFTDHRLVGHLNASLNTLSSTSAGLYKVGTATLTKADGVEGYDLAGITGLIRLLEVRRQVSGTSRAWPRVPQSEWDLLRSAPTEFGSGMALRLIGCGATAGYGIEVVYAAAFTALANLTDDVTLTGLPASACDLPPLGAALRIMAGREVARNAVTVQGDSRRAQEVGPGAVAASTRGLMQLFAQRLAEENSRLRTMFPVGK